MEGIVEKKKIYNNKIIYHLAKFGICGYNHYGLCKFGEKCNKKHVSHLESHARIVKGTGVCYAKELTGEECIDPECAFAHSLAEASENCLNIGFNPKYIMINYERGLSEAMKLKNEEIVPNKRVRI